MDRLLAPEKRTIRRRLYGRTQPGRLLKHHIPVETDHWDVTEPGFTEVDLVSHSGDRADGGFLHTLNLTDIRHYDAPQTPLDRVRTCPQATPAAVAALVRQRDQLDPFALPARVDRKLARLYTLANHRRAVPTTTEGARWISQPHPPHDGLRPTRCPESGPRAGEKGTPWHWPHPAGDQPACLAPSSRATEPGATQFDHLRNPRNPRIVPSA